MFENLGVALQITVVGMGLVFAAILVLWGLIALLVRATATVAAPEPEAALLPTVSPSPWRWLSGHNPKPKFRPWPHSPSTPGRPCCAAGRWNAGNDEVG
jgi:hypothetical protein